MSILVIADIQAGEITEETLELVEAARQTKSETTVAVITAELEPNLDKLKIDAVTKILVIQSASKEFDSDTYRRAAEVAIVHVEPKVTLFVAKVNAMSVAPAVAAKLNCGFASDLIGLDIVDGELIARRSTYSGKITAELAFPNKASVVASLRSGIWTPSEFASAEPEVINLDMGSVESRTRHTSFITPENGDAQDIGDAEFIICLGRGIDDEDAAEEFKELADQMGATLAVSRPLVDSGWFPKTLQIGQSGQTVMPKIYLSFGVSGAVQHLAGMKNSGTIIAINKDADASIFEVADYGATLDLFDVAEHLKACF